MKTHSITTLTLFAAVIYPDPARSTPSSTFWTPSTASCQAWKVPHLTFDNYFARGATYPHDVGLTMGILPWEKIQGEVGFDALYPTPDPFYFNGRLCIPDSSWLKGLPAVAVGIYEIGTHTDVSNYNVIYFTTEKALPWGGSISAGVYHGLSRRLFTNSDGTVVQTGAVIGAVSPDIEIGLTGLKKVKFAADIQTGKNILGAWGEGAYVYFSDNVSLLSGPVYFLDPNAQPGTHGFLWTIQMDIDIPLSKPNHS